MTINCIFETALFITEKDVPYVEMLLAASIFIIMLNFYLMFPEDDESSSEEAIEDQRLLDEARARAKQNRNEYVD